MSNKKRTNWPLVFGAIVAIGILGNFIKPNNQAQSSAKAPESPKQQIAKKDGSIDARPNDLHELCKDFVYYKAKAYKYGREGQQEKAQEARVSLDKTNIWLSQYHEADVANTCAQYDTKENLAKYMR